MELQEENAKDLGEELASTTGSPSPPSTPRGSSPTRLQRSGSGSFRGSVSGSSHHADVAARVGSFRGSMKRSPSGRLVRVTVPSAGNSRRSSVASGTGGREASSSSSSSEGRAGGGGSRGREKQALSSINMAKIGQHAFDSLPRAKKALRQLQRMCVGAKAGVWHAFLGRLASYYCSLFRLERVRREMEAWKCNDMRRQRSVLQGMVQPPGGEGRGGHGGPGRRPGSIPGLPPLPSAKKVEEQARETAKRVVEVAEEELMTALTANPWSSFMTLEMERSYHAGLLMATTFFLRTVFPDPRMHGAIVAHMSQLFGNPDNPPATELGRHCSVPLDTVLPHNQHGRTLPPLFTMGSQRGGLRNVGVGGSMGRTGRRRQEEAPTEGEDDIVLSIRVNPGTGGFDEIRYPIRRLLEAAGSAVPLAAPTSRGVRPRGQVRRNPVVQRTTLKPVGARRPPWRVPEEALKLDIPTGDLLQEHDTTHRHKIAELVNFEADQFRRMRSLARMSSVRRLPTDLLR